MPISTEDRAKLIALAHASVASAVTGEKPSQIDTKTSGGILDEHRGCFVTLKNSGRLRGCIGTFIPTAVLGQTIVQMSQAAATQDSRFFDDPITPAELEQLSIEVSVLSPLTQTDDPAGLEIGKHGIYIVSGGQSGCFLPEVAVEMNWSAEQFLDHCCTGKAGMKAGAWRQGETKVSLFTSEKFDR